jgi:hypothetical protein
MRLLPFILKRFTHFDIPWGKKSNFTMIFFKKNVFKAIRLVIHVKVSSTAAAVSVIEEVNLKIGRDNLGAQASIYRFLYRIFASSWSSITAFYHF